MPNHIEEKDVPIPTGRINVQKQVSGGRSPLREFMQGLKMWQSFTIDKQYKKHVSTIAYRIKKELGFTYVMHEDSTPGKERVWRVK